MGKEKTRDLVRKSQQESRCEMTRKSVVMGVERRGHSQSTVMADSIGLVNQWNVVSGG